MKAMLSKINANEANDVHDSGLQEESSLSLPLAGIGLTISSKSARFTPRVAANWVQLVHA
jgi:hypothetical protein